MSAENVETLRQGYDRVAREGPEAMTDLVDPSFEFVIPPEMSAEPDTYVGAEGIRRWYAGWDGTMEEIRFETYELIDAGDKVLAHMRLRATGSSSGIEVDQEGFQVWSFRDGRAVRLETFPDLESAKTAAGL